MKHLLKSFQYQFSYVLRSPINIQLLKNQEGLEILKKSLKARFKDENNVLKLQDYYEQYRTSM